MGARLSYPETDQSGKVAVVTGGNTGIGYETAKGLALLGAHVILACRNEERARGAIERMRGEVSQEHPNKTINVEFMSLDLSSLQSVKNFIEDYKQKGLPLHLVINNAGMGMWGKPDIRLTEDGNELHFQVNHLGHFYLTLELLPIILSSAPGARIVFVSSKLHEFSKPFDPNNLQGQQRYDAGLQYCITKLCNIMTAESLQRRLTGKGVTVSALHPGMVRTEIGRDSSGIMPAFVAALHALRVTRDPKKGAATTLYAAVHPDLNKEEFVYYSDCKAASSSGASRNVTHQEQLWDISCNLLKDHLSPDIWREYGPSQPTTSGEGGEEQPSSEQVGEQPSSEQVEEQSLEQVEEHPSEQVGEQPSSEQVGVSEQSSSEQVEEQPPSGQVDEQLSSEQVEEQHSSGQVEGQPPLEQVEEQSPSEQVEEHGIPSSSDVNQQSHSEDSK